MISFDPAYGPAIAERAGTCFNPQCDRVVCRLDDEGALLGGSVFQNYTGASIGMHAASWRQRWVTRALLYATFAYPFIQLGCERVFGQVPADNHAALNFDLNLGFQVIATIPNVFKNHVDCLVVCMEKDECRFIR